MSVGARNLHRMAGVLDRLRREALAGTCELAGCDRPAAGFIENCVTLRPAGVCAVHGPQAQQLGYIVHHTLED